MRRTRSARSTNEALLAGLTRRSPPPGTARRSRRRAAADLQRALAEAGLAWGAPLLLRVFKREKRLECWVRGTRTYRLFCAYPLLAASGTLGPKCREGDEG